MRRLALILLLAGTAVGDEVVLREERFWKGVVEVSSISKEPPAGQGREIQSERVEFVLKTEPPRRSIAWPRLPFAMREAQGGYELRLDVVDGEGESRLVRKGAGGGRLHPRVGGWIEPTTGRYRLEVAVRPDRLLARTTISGTWQGSFTTWRTVSQRRPFLLRFEAEGEGGRVLEGSRTFLDRHETLDREVTITWRVERMDPVVRGRVVDHHGRPVAGLAVVATHTNPERRARRLPPLRHEAESGGDGRFEMEAFFAPWTVRVEGEERDGVVYEGARAPGDVQLRIDEVPRLELSVKAYDLARLPYARLLRGHFRGDVAEFLAYVRARAPEAALERALLAPPAEREVAAEPGAELR